VKFKCPKCQTRHQIEDRELPVGQALRFTCPNCSHTLGLRRREETARPPADAAQSDAMPPLPPSPGDVPTGIPPAPPPMRRPAAPPQRRDNPFEESGARASEPQGETPDEGGGISDPDEMPPARAGYHTAAPGESTRMFMDVAGIYRHRRNTKIAAISAGVFTVLLSVVLVADVTGIISIPFLGAVYDMTGMADPNVARAIARVESKLHDVSLSAEEREALRRKLLGLSEAAPKTSRAKGTGPVATAPATPGPTPTPTSTVTQGVADTKSLDTHQRGMAEDVFGAGQKKERELRVVDADDIQAPNLPQGLTHDAIYKVINDNSRSMSLCYAEASRRGQRMNGKMEIQITINAAGQVADVSIETPRFQRTPMGFCAAKRVKNWRFPRFNGEPVTVVFPYVLSAGL
jgi:predicted Zn finger-like uncharacterized protein